MSGPEEANLLVRASGQPWQQPSAVGYLNEADLQAMLAEQPSLIPGVSAEASAVREFHTGVGPSDVIIVDTNGQVTVVECKLASNAEIRRKIIGQVLDYAARLWRMPVVDFDAQWRQCSGGDSVLDGLDDEATQALENALDTGTYRLVLAVDSINDDLRRIVEYLNLHTTEGLSVLALELRRASHGGVDILTPRTFGQELARAKTEAAKRQHREPWQIDDVLRRLEEFRPSLRPALESLISSLTKIGCEAVGTAASKPSMIFKLPMPEGGVSWPYAIYTGSKPVVQVNFRWLTAADETAREAFLSVLAADPIALDAEAIRASGYQKRPAVPLAMAAERSVVQQLTEAVSRLLDPSSHVP